MLSTIFFHKNALNGSGAVHTDRQAEEHDFVNYLNFGEFYCEYAKERKYVTSHSVSINFFRDAIKRCLF
jgi:hypothetical protein